MRLAEPAAEAAWYSGLGPRRHRRSRYGEQCPVLTSAWRRSEGAKERRSEGAKERRSEGAKERRSEGAKERRSEGAKERRSEGAKERRSEGAKERRSEGPATTRTCRPASSLAWASPSPSRQRSRGRLSWWPGCSLVVAWRLAGSSPWPWRWPSMPCACGRSLISGRCGRAWGRARPAARGPVEGLGGTPWARWGALVVGSCAR